MYTSVQKGENYLRIGRHINKQRVENMYILTLMRSSLQRPLDLIIATTVIELVFWERILYYKMRLIGQSIFSKAESCSNGLCFSVFINYQVLLPNKMDFRKRKNGFPNNIWTTKNCM